jgi:hypothetical protein
LGTAHGQGIIGEMIILPGLPLLTLIKIKMRKKSPEW